jgi:uncharacterized membrane protein YcaP (DUF421 family)
MLDLDLIALLEVVLRTAAVYFALLVGLRLAGKRELGQMTAFDLVVLLVIANAVQNAMVGDDTSLTGGIVAAATLLAVNRVIGEISLRSPAVRKRLRGVPTLLVHDGAILKDQLRSEGVDREEILQALREHGVDDISSVSSAVLEVDGTISVITGAKVTRSSHRAKGIRT